MEKKKLTISQTHFDILSKRANELNITMDDLMNLMVESLKPKVIEEKPEKTITFSKMFHKMHDQSFIIRCSSKLGITRQKLSNLELSWSEFIDMVEKL